MSHRPRNVLKINLALSDDPIYIEVDDPNMAIEDILRDAVIQLNESGEHHRAQQLAAYITQNGYELIDVNELKHQQTGTNHPETENSSNDE